MIAQTAPSSSAWEASELAGLRPILVRALTFCASTLRMR